MQDCCDGAECFFFRLWTFRADWNVCYDRVRAARVRIRRKSVRVVIGGDGDRDAGVAGAAGDAVARDTDLSSRLLQ